MGLPQVYKVVVTFEKAISFFGKEVQDLTIAVSRNELIRTADDAVAHVMMVVAKTPEGKPVTMIRHRDEGTGEYTCIVKAVPVSEEPFSAADAPVIASIQGVPEDQKRE